MKFFLISDNVDTKMGMRFAGIEGVVVHQEDEVRSQLDKAMKKMKEFFATYKQG
mgnify:CR=1 FL=1